VTFLIDGPDTFRAMMDAIRTAQQEDHYIYLLGWDYFDNFRLVTGRLKRSPSDPPDASDPTMGELLADASARRAQIRVMLWDQVGRQNSREVDRIQALPTGAAILDNETPNPITAFGSHHQKLLVVKGSQGLIGFCGGLDLNPNRITVVKRNCGEEYHDDHCRIVGPAARDLLTTFIMRWDHHPRHVEIDRNRGDLLGRRPEPVPSPLTPPGAGLSSTGGTCSVRIARTFNPVTRVPGSSAVRERTLQASLTTAIRNAQRFIYMEEQYLINLDAADLLRAALPRIAHLTVVIPSSTISDLPCVWKLRRDFISRLTAGLSPADVAKARIFFLVSPPASSPPVLGQHTYVHAKTWVFDDELAVIGTANCNQRSWTHDSEVNAFIFDDHAPSEPLPDLGTLTPTFAQQLRMRLWSEHLNVPMSAVVDGEASAGLWLSPPLGSRIARYDPLAGRDFIPATGVSVPSLGIPTIPVPAALFTDVDRICDLLSGVIDPRMP
jgi:phosphatidylserine/phosphatidylglycerophosphate/cardiolipin synthase-like enzyme